ncbi:MAG: peptide ABC transporter substrate-binding protein [Oscillospiraceae bacterium]|jgi:oligopeptide transport system substrate-binding protein|nr:peptide ABC transporter substrate-binding protein [Oscillospiraceae bacterium]
MKKRWTSISIATSILAISLSGCTGKKPTTEKLDLKVCIASEPATLDPTLSNTVDAAVMLNHTNEGLYKLKPDENGKLISVPGQAESMEKKDTENGTVYTFHLRNGIKWSDGQPVKATDFVYAWRRLVTPKNAAEYHYILESVANAQEILKGNADPSTLGVKAVDDKTLEVTLSQPCPYFETLLFFPALYPVRQDIVEKYGDKWTQDPTTFPCNGPYSFKEWAHESYILMEQNQHYWDQQSIGPNSLKFMLMKDVNSTYNAYNAGELDYIVAIPPEEALKLKEDGKLHISDTLSSSYMIFNYQKTPFDNPKVRKAFSLVIDRNSIIQNIAHFGKPAGGFVPFGIKDADGDFRANGGDYYSVKKEDYQKNCDEARKLFAEAGYSDGENFPTVTYLTNSEGPNRQIAEAIQHDITKALKVTISVELEDWNTFCATRKEGNFLFCRGGWNGDWDDPTTFLKIFLKDTGNNEAHYDNPEYEKLLSDAERESDPVKRMQLLHQAEDIVIGKDYAVAPLIFGVHKCLIKDDIKGVGHNSLGIVLFAYAHK